MKKLAYILSIPAMVLGCGMIFCSTASAQVVAHDDAGAYSVANLGWNDGDNRGFGFKPWALKQTGSSANNFTGFFIGDGDGISTTNSSAFGMYANGASGTNMSVASRGFSNSLTTSVVFKVQWHNNGIGGTVNNVGGFALRNGNPTNGVADVNTGIRFGFAYFGGGLDSYAITDGNGINYIGLPFASSPFSTEFTLIDANNYRFVVKDAAGVNVLFVTNSPLTGSGTIDSVACFAQQTDGNQDFNNLEISSTSLVPPTIVNVLPTNGSIFLNPATTTVSFEVDSAFSTIATNNISLTLNGVAKTNLFFTGGSTNRIVTLGSNSLAADIVYNAVILATDSHGNVVSNIFTFNTWSSNLLFIEAEDYNFGAGGFLPGGTPSGNITPNQYGVTSGNPLFGTNGIDYFKPNPSDAGSNQYRPGDLVDLDSPPISADVDHNGFIANGYVDYNLSFIDANEWQNYTRAFSTNTSYNVYARMASLSGNPVMEMDRDAAATATSTNQPLMPLGTCVCPANTGGGQGYVFVQLRDIFSQPVLLRLSGTNTLRTTRIGGSYNFNYLVFVPNNTTNTLRPYVSFGFPFPGATGVGPDSKISFNLANRQTTVTSANIHLAINAVDVTGSLVIATNAAGAAVSYTPTTLLPVNSTNTITVTFTDSASVITTNTWTFTTANPTVVPTAYAQASPGTSAGFTIHIAKADDNAPATLFPATVARAELQLTSTISDTNGTPYPNIALNNGQAVETNVINYDIDALGGGTFTNDLAFPDVPAAPTNNYMAMEALMYVPLTNGVYTFAVNSDDGFKFTTGTSPSSTNLTLGIFDGGRGATESTFDFIIQTNGYYPMRLLYFQGQFGGSVELYSVSRIDGTRILLNNLSNSNAVKTFQASSATTRVPITITRSGTNVILNWTGSHTLQSATTINSTNSGFTDVSPTVLTSPYTNSISTVRKYFRLRN